MGDVNLFVTLGEQSRMIASVMFQYCTCLAGELQVLFPLVEQEVDM